MDPILPSSAFGAVGTLALLLAIAGSAIAEQLRSATALALRNTTLPPSRLWRAAGLVLGAALGAALAAIPNPALLTWVAIAMATAWTAGRIAPLPAVLRPLARKTGRPRVRNALGATAAGVVLTAAAVYEWPVVRHHVAGVIVATLIGVVAIRRPWRIASRWLLVIAGGLGFVVALETWLRDGIAAAGWYVPVFAALAAAVAGCVASSSARAGLLEAIGLKDAAAGAPRAAARVSRVAVPSALAGGLAGMVAVPASGARWLALGAVGVALKHGRRRIAALIDTAAPELGATTVPAGPDDEELPSTTDVGHMSLRSVGTWVVLIVLSVIGGLASNMLYGIYTIAGSIAASTGIEKVFIVVLPAVGIAVAMTMLMPYTALKGWLTPASLAVMAGFAFLIGRASGWAVIPLILGGSCFYLAPFSLWARVAATLPKSKAGELVGHVYFGMMLTSAAAIAYVFGRAVGEIGPGTRERVEDVFLLFAIALAVSAPLARWLTPPLPQAELEARRRKTGHPIGRPWLTLLNPHIRRVAWLYGLSGAALAMLDSSITLAVLDAQLTEEHSAQTGLAIFLGGPAAPLLNSVYRSGRAKMLGAGFITFAGLAVAALFGGRFAAAAALLPALIAGRTAVETGTSQTTMAGPDVVRGDEDVMSVLQAFKAFFQVPAVLIGVLVLFALGPHVGLTGWRLVMVVAGLVMLTYLALAAGLPREEPIVEELPDGAGYVFTHARDRTLVLAPNATPQVLMSAYEATVSGPRPVRLFYGYGRAVGPSGRDDLLLGSALLQDMERVALAWPGVTAVTNTDVAWIRGRYVGVVGVEFADGSEDAKHTICSPLAHQLREQLGLGLVLVGQRKVPRLPAWRSRIRQLRPAGRHVKALLFARLAGSRPLRQVSPTSSWMRIGDELGVGNILGSDVRSAADRYGIGTETWSIEPSDDGWTLCIEADGTDRQRARFEAYLAASLRLTGISGVDVQRRPEPVTT